MAEFSNEVPEVTRCNTCKASFSSVAMIRQHYRSDWHVFNSKRRSAGLVRATWEEFRALSSSTKSAKPSSKSPQKVTKEKPVTSRPVPTSSSAPQKSVVATGEKQTSTEKNANKDLSELNTNFVKLAEEFGVDSKDRIDNIVSMAVEHSTTKGSDEDESDDESEEEDIIIEDNISIFDDKEFDTVEENVAYMEETFGFFIPEREYLTNLSALVIYLGEKVKLGGICIYCQKQFRPGRSCQNHMKAKSHCKIAYQEDVDLDEFDDFYDFSSSYKSIEGGDEEKSDNDLLDNTLEVSAIGELVLTDGRCVGHRAFRKYYKQKYKPEENRDSVIVARKEELLKLYKGGGYTARAIVNGKIQTQAISTLSDAEVMSLIVKQHKEQKKFQMIAQRAEKRLTFANNRREYKSVTDKLRSSATTTAKIRDYHSMLC